MREGKEHDRRGQEGSPKVCQMNRSLGAMEWLSQEKSWFNTAGCSAGMQPVPNESSMN